LKSKKILKLPLSYELENSFDEERFLKMRIKVMHSGLNLNNSYFSSEAIDKAKPTLANIPILAFVKREDGSDDEDFAGHEFEIKLTQDDVKFVYLGRPIGIIPETNNYSVEADTDGQRFVVVDGYIWKDYANSALDIINRDEIKKVSMEVNVNDYSWEDSYIQILDYSYTGIAMLGDGVQEAMIGAKAEIINYSKTKNTISEMLFELNDALKGGQENMKDETKDFTQEEEVEVEVQVEGAEETTEEFENEETTEEEIETQETTNQEFEEESEENEETNEEFNHSEEEQEDDSTNFEAEIATLKQQIADLQTENQRLQNFVDETQTKAKEDAITELFAKFEDLEDIEEAGSLKEKAAELTLSDLETQLFALRGKYNTYSAAKETQETDWSKLIFNHESKEDDGPEWADLISKS